MTDCRGNLGLNEFLGFGERGRFSADSACLSPGKNIEQLLISVVSPGGLVSQRPNVSCRDAAQPSTVPKLGKLST